MSTPVVPITIRNLRTSLHNTFEEAKGTVSSDLMEIVEKVPSTTLFNTYGWLGAFPKFREWVGPRLVNSLAGRVYQIFNKKYELTIGQDEAYSEDMGLADMQIIMRGMAQEAAYLPNDLIVDLLKNGQSRVCYDGQFFFDTDHPVNPDNAGAGTQSNYEAAAFALTRANFITARARIYKFLGENGRNIRAPRKLILVVPPDLQAAAEDIVGVDKIAIAGGAQDNVLKNAAKVIVVPELQSQATTWYLIAVGDMPPAFILQERKAPQFVAKNKPEDDNKFWNGEDIFGADARYGAGYGAWFRAFKGVG